MDGLPHENGSKFTELFPGDANSFEEIERDKSAMATPWPC